MLNILRPIVGVFTVCAAVCGCTFIHTPSDEIDIPKDFEMPTFVLRAAQSLTIENGAKISGGAIAGKRVVVSGAQVESVFGPSVQLDSAFVRGGVFTDELDSHDSEYGFRSPFVPDALSALNQRPVVAPGDGELVVRSGEEVVLEASVGPVHVHEGGTLLIKGGFYELESLMIDAEASVVVLEASKLTVGDWLSMGANAYIGPPPRSNVALNLQIHVAGRDTHDAVAVEIGEGASIAADLLAPAGTILMRQNSSAVGRFEAQDIGVATGVFAKGLGIGLVSPCGMFKCWGEAVAGGTIDFECGFVNLNPDLDTWLNSHSKIRDAIKWQYTVNGSSYEPQEQDMVAYVNWTAAEKAQLDQSYNTYWKAYCQGQPLQGDIGLADPLANVADNINNDTSKARTRISEQDMRKLLLANIGHSLVLELGDYVPWSVLGDDDDSLEIYFASLGLGRRSPYDEFSTGESGPLSYLQDWHVSHGRSTPSPPAWTFDFLKSNGLLGATRYDTIVNLLNWSRDNMIHFYGNHWFNRVEEIWQYRGHPPVSRVVSGTTDPFWSFEHWTAGCHGTAGWYRAVLRTANIPVQIPLACNHAQIYFRSEGLYLDHGDNPYTGYANATWPPEDALIDEPTYVAWFGPNLDHQTTNCENVGRRPKELNQAPNP